MSGVICPHGIGLTLLKFRVPNSTFYFDIMSNRNQKHSDCCSVSYWIRCYKLFIVAIRINFETSLPHRGIGGLIGAALFSYLLICHYRHFYIRTVQTKEYEVDVTSSCFHTRIHILSVF